MKIRKFVIVLGFIGTLIGCSSKPDVSDIAVELNKGWARCPLVKMSDLKKINGLDKGNIYRMAFSYKLEFQYDESQAEKRCATGNLIVLGQEVRPFKFNKGDVITLTNEVDMVKSENGWIMQ